MSCKSFFLILAVLMVGSLSAQAPYQDAVGLRLGFPVSVSYKKFLNEKAAVEGYVGLRSYGFGSWFNISGAYQVHQPISEIEGLQWYYGGGASIFFWNYDDVFLEDDFSSTSFGVQGYLGLDYTFSEVPISLTADWIPTFFFGGDININSFGAGFGSLGVRYLLNR